MCSIALDSEEPMAACTDLLPFQQIEFGSGGRPDPAIKRRWWNRRKASFPTFSINTEVLYFAVLVYAFIFYCIKISVI
jgi:hypothetical protein